MADFGNNTADLNTGNWNTGHRNTGNWNTGNWNTGHRNTGNCNAGDRNTGHLNTGNWNTGHRNTGNWNTGNNHTGCFNTDSAEKAYYFNKLLNVKDWDKANKPDWIYEPSTTSWVTDSEMTDEEKQANPTFRTTGGYMRTNDMVEEWSKAYANASNEDIQAVRDLPNFDADVFKKITGLDLSVDNPKLCSGRIVEIDGVKYKLEEVK